MAEMLVFFSLAALTLIPAFMVVRSPNVLHAGYWLLPCFVGIAGMFAALEAHFFFVVQLLVYAGAILVLILFAVMLTRNVMDPHVPQTNRLAGWAALLCAGVAAGASWALATHPWSTVQDQPAAALEQTRALGLSLIGLYAIPFEAASLILLAALIGAVALAKSEREAAPPVPPLARAESEQEESAELAHV